MKQINRLSILIFLLGIIVTCRRDQSIDETESVIKEETQTKTILSSIGGAIELESGVKVEFSANAFLDDKNITVETIDHTLKENFYKIPDELKGEAMVSAIVRCTPEGITFNNPVKIAIPYYSELLTDTIPIDSIFVVSCSSDSIELVPFSIDKINQTVIAEVMHFSDYAIIVKVGLLISRGKIYKTVKINGKNWMAENLAYLPIVSPPSDYSYTEPLFYVYGYNGRNVSEAKEKKYKDYYRMYGVLYNWAAAKIACPVGWHLPTDDEWKQLEMGLGMSQIEADKFEDRGTDQGTKMKANKGWFEGNDTDPSTGNGTNTSGFSGLPGGSRHIDGVFDGDFQFGNWWGSTENSICCAPTRILGYNKSTVYRTNYNKLFGFSVRCVKD